MTQPGKKDQLYTFEEPCLVCHGDGVRFSEHSELKAVCQVCEGSGHKQSTMTPEELREAERAHRTRLAKGELKYSL